jgi:hypothetical protein
MVYFTIFYRIFDENLTKKKFFYIVNKSHGNIHQKEQIKTKKILLSDVSINKQCINISV